MVLYCCHRPRKLALNAVAVFCLWGLWVRGEERVELRWLTWALLAGTPRVKDGDATMAGQESFEDAFTHMSDF